MAFPNLDLANMRFPVTVQSDLLDKRPDIADVLYGAHRCSHGHGDELPSGFELVDYVSDTVFQFYAGKDGSLRLPAAVVLGLLAVAVFAPENISQRARNDDAHLCVAHYCSYPDRYVPAEYLYCNVNLHFGYAAVRPLGLRELTDDRVDLPTVHGESLRCDERVLIDRYDPVLVLCADEGVALKMEVYVPLRVVRLVDVGAVRSAGTQDP